jgi:tetratricopeptide (TPR) repeat protein
VQQDLLLRMIAQLSTFVMGIKRLREQKQWEEVHEQIGDGIGRFVGLNASLVHAISEDDLIQLLSTRGGVDLDRWWALAELLREEGLALEEQGDTAGAERAFAKSLRLYLEVLHEAEEVPTYLNVTDLEAVITRMLDRDLSRSTRLALIEYLVDTGRYDQAENVALWALDGPDARALDDARAFYESLRAKSDAELEAGGLSREEIALGLDALTTE